MSTEPDPKILEENVSTLIESGGEAPRMSDIARARIKSALVDAHGAKPSQIRVASRRTRNLAIGGGLVAAAAAALIVVTHRPGGGPDSPTPTPVDNALALTDGTTIVRGDGAVVTVLGPRHVRVTGAALLDVTPGAGTFVVETARGRVEVLGTRFLVDAEPARTTADVVRGQVKLISDTGDVLLHAGEEGIAEPGKPPTRGPAPRLSHLVSWAQQTRHKLEHDEPVHHGTLFARQPNNPNAPETPLPMAKLSVDVVVENQVARVALDQTFHNPENAELEGMYRFAIPPDAALQRLAMYVDGRLTESAVVERMAARRIYEEQVYRRVDPALLEWAGTGRLALRVYPLHAEQDKRLVLAYTQSLPKLYDDWTLTVPLPEVDQPVGELAFTVRVAGCANCELTSPSHAITVTRAGNDALVSYSQAGARAGDSLVVHVRDPRHATTVAEQHDGPDRYLMVRAPADLASGPAAYRPRTWVILDDVSASRDAMARRAQADLIDGFLRELDEDDRVSVVAFDVSARVLLKPTRVLDADRSAVRKALADEGDVGATDVGVALDAALAQLAGTAPDDAMIVYLGDGVITSGTRHLDELRSKLTGKAHFVGVGVGDGPDTQTLDALASATGGYATTIDLADDVSWRAFDLVAALHTARVTDVAARIVDSSGAPIPATLYAPSQIADGEELELVAKLTGSPAPAVAVELTGTLGGQRWSRRIPLDGALATTAPHAPSDAGYLPRLWAQRHIAARLLAKHEPVVVPPCAPPAGTTRATPMCQTEGQVRDARDEVIRREIIELGKRYFLLSRHTSLLVLENDAMYAQYGITKGRGDTWAPYALPATIPVVTSATPVVTLATPADVAGDAELVRQPLSIFYTYPTYQNQQFGDDLGVNKGFSPIAGAWGGDLQIETKTVSRNGMRGRISDRDADAHVEGGVVGGEVARNEKTDPSSTMALDEGHMGKKDSEPQASDKPTESEPMAEAKADRRATSVGFDDGGYFATAQAGGGGGGRIGRGHAVAGTDSSTYRAFASMQPLMAQRYVSPGDAAFDDLTAFVPALFPDAADAWRGELVAGDAKDTKTPHTIEDAARARLADARAKLPSGIYRWGDYELAVDDARRIGWRRISEVDLAETASFDGTTWTRRYPELGLDATRAVGDDDIALALGYLPVWIAAPEHFGKYFDVRARGAHEVVLAHGDRVAFVLAFDDASHLTSVHDGTGREVVAVTWTPSGPVAGRVGGEDINVGYTGQAMSDAPAWAHRDAPASAVVVELPARVPSFWDEQRKAASVGSPTWRRAVRQHMVALAAIHAAPQLRSDALDLAAHGGLELGDIVLASQGIGQLFSAQELAALPASPVTRYLAEHRRGREKSAPPGPAVGFIGAFTTLRMVAEDAQAGQAQAALERIVQLGERAPLLRVIATTALANTGQLAPEKVVRAWDMFTSGPYHNVARAQAALALQQQGRVEDAAARYATLASDYDLHALPVQLASARYAFQQSRRGQAGWDMAAAQLRDRVLPTGSYAHVVALLGVTDSRADRMRVLSRAAELASGDPGRIADVARTAAQLGESAWAAATIQPLVLTAPTREIDQLAAQLALQQGHVAEGLADLEQAQTLGGDEPTSIQVVRGEMSTIISVAQRLAQESSGAAKQDAITRALRWGKRWRAIDPGNAQVDLVLGEMLLGVGDNAEAWRQMSTLIERDPMSGDGYQAVANAFERQGKVADALDYWEQALRIDQTNPTPRLRKAQALYALGRSKDGDAALRDITSKHWHEKWEWTVENARELLQEHHGQ